MLRWKVKLVTKTDWAKAVDLDYPMGYFPKGFRTKVEAQKVVDHLAENGIVATLTPKR